MLTSKIKGSTTTKVSGFTCFGSYLLYAAVVQWYLVSVSRGFLAILGECTFG